MKKLIVLVLMATTILLSACGSSDKDKITKIDEVPQSVFSDYNGVWELKGTGDVWVINDEKLTTYNFNSFGCIKNLDIELTDIEEAVNYLSINEESTEITFDNLGSSKESYQLIEQIPKSCKTDNLLAQTDLATNFEFLWHTMNDYYAFFELRDIDWQGVYEEYRPQVTSTTTKHQFLNDGRDF